MEEEFAQMQQKLFSDYPEEEELLYKPLDS